MFSFKKLIVEGSLSIGDVIYIDYRSNGICRLGCNVKLCRKLLTCRVGSRDEVGTQASYPASRNQTRRTPIRRRRLESKVVIQ